ncbi:MAG TPA: hypothetical protein VFC65_14430 [Prolixibacteraceae bacterium]|nr:hypothetical protein [Prolixibacteraceae bacterium]
MKKLFFIFVLIIISSSVLTAQKTEIVEKLREDRIDSLLNLVIFNEDDLSYLFNLKKNYQFLYARTSYNTKTFFAGREIGKNQYNLSAQLFYLHSSGIHAGISGAWYSQLDPGYRTTVLSLGYSKGLKKLKFFRYRLSYDYFLFNDDDPNYKPLYTSSLNTGITLKTKNTGTRANLSVLLGQETGTQFTWDFYSYINLIKLGNYDKIRLEPEVSLYFGSETVEHQLNEVLIDPLTNIEYDSYYKDEFGLLNIQLEIPISINFKSFDLEAAWIYNFPQTMNKNITYPDNSFFRVSLGYIFKL